MLLIHTCCAVCYLNFFESSQNELNLSESEITLYFNNPNIHPRSEWLTRLEALKRVTKTKKHQLIVKNYKPAEYFKNLNLEKQESNILHPASLILDRKLRCPKCWYLRLAQSFEYARANGFDCVTSTLLLSQHQDREAIDRIGKVLAQQYRLNWFLPKNEHHCKNLCGFYKQNYCGCVYSLVEKIQEKYS